MYVLPWELKWNDVVLLQIEKYDKDYHEGGTKTLVPDNVYLEQAVEKRVAEKEANHLQLNVTKIPPPLLPPPLPPAPPPLPPQADIKNKNYVGEHKTIIWMKKYL